jgi:hypothetical protein
MGNSSGSHPLQKAQRTRISGYAALYMSACAAFYEESRMSFGGAHQDQQEIRGLGHPEIRCWFR